MGKSSRTRGVAAPSWTGMLTSEQVEDPQRVVGAGSDRVVAVHGRRRHQLQLGMQGREHQGDGVVRAGVDVEDQLLARAHRRA